MTSAATLTPRVRAAMRANHSRTYGEGKCEACWMMKDATNPCHVIKMLDMIEDLESQLTAAHLAQQQVSILMTAAREYAATCIYHTDAPAVSVSPAEQVAAHRARERAEQRLRRVALAVAGERRQA